MCRVLAVSRSGFYSWLKRQAQSPGPREMANQKLITAIQTTFEQSRRTYGAPRIHASLVKLGFVCSKRRVAKLMRTAGIIARCKTRRKVTTDSKHEQPVAPNVLERQFTATAPDQKWLVDLTYVATREGWLYLAGLLDVYSRRIVGWAMDKTMGQDLVRSALEMALAARKPGKGLLHHSDRGSQYAANDYQARLVECGMVSSMSRKADCYDNAMVESFWSTLKTECANNIFNSRAIARQAIFEYIEVWYNRNRIHSALGYTNPAAFEQLHHRAFQLSTLLT